MKPVLLLLLVALAACGDFPGVSDNATCQELADEFSAAIASVGRSCDTVADCASPGGPLGETCNCTPALPQFAVNRDAYVGSTAAELSSEFSARCADDPDAPAVCDAAPSDLDCVNGTCQLTDRSCFESDAGVP